jgi:DNA (cytosine-5)-methyltransferase 1
MRIVDLFVGAGGLTLGFELAGHEVVAGYDNWDPARLVYEKNFSHPFIHADLADVPSTIQDIKRFSPEMIIGGPPCQDFSSAGKRNETLGRANLTVAFAEVVVGVGSEWFVMENVARAQKSDAMERARQIFIGAGYGLVECVIDASRCGVPQRRKRMFMVGRRGGLDNKLFEDLNERANGDPTTLREYFGDSLDFEHYYRHPRSYQRRGIFSIDEPSPTIRGVNRPLPAGYPGHRGDTAPADSDIRPLTTDERALIQTFPSDFIWEGTKTSKEQLIGNAVPPLLAKFVAEAVLQTAYLLKSQEIPADQLALRWENSQRNNK